MGNDNSSTATAQLQTAMSPLDATPNDFSSTRAWSRLSRRQGDDFIVARRNKEAISDQDFRARVGSWRTLLDSEPAETVALYEPDGAEFAAALLGAWYAHKTVFLPGDVQPATCRALRAQNALLLGSFPLEVEHLARPELRPTAHGPNTTFSPLDADSARLVIFTSGSSGAPQAVPKRLTQLLAEVNALEKMFGEQLRGEIVATVSHQHIYGLLFKILWPLAYHRTFVADSLLYPEQLSEVVRERDVAIVSGPAHLKRLPDTLDWREAAAHVSMVFSSGGPLALEAAQLAQELLGSAPVEVYGSSETGGVAWRKRSLGVDVPWRALAGVEVRGSDGRLAVRSSHLPTHEWFLIEDHAEFNEDGGFVLKGRADRIAKIEGKRISLVAMEAAMLETGLVSEVRLVQLESSRDEIGAAVVPSDAGWDVIRASGSSALQAKLNDCLKTIVERIAYPRRWRWVDTLPVNASGKTTNAAIVALFGQAGLTMPAVHVLSSSHTDAHIELYVSKHLPVFDGHFRDTPVLPGVAQVDWAIVLGKKVFNISAPFQKLEAVKFQRVYQPGPMLSLQLNWNAERQLLQFRYESADATHSSGRIFFAK